MVGPDQSDEWKREGRRIIPLLPRAAPITGYTQVAEAGKADIGSLNDELPAPWDTRTVRPLPPLQRDAKPEPELFVKPEPVPELNGSDNNTSASSPEKIKAEVKEEPEDDETGVVFLPSGMAVRLREDKPAPAAGGKKGGKRKRSRSVSKSIEVFPKGVPISSPGRRGSVSSPPRKVASPLSPVHQAGHGYARPPPETPPQNLPQSPARGGGSLANNHDISAAQLFTPPKRGPGRPPGSSSPSVGRGGAVRTRAPRAPRARGPRSRGGGRGGTTRPPPPPPPPPPVMNNVPVVITQSPLVQGPAGQTTLTPLVGGRTFRTSTPKVTGLTSSKEVKLAGLESYHPQDLSISGGGASKQPSIQSLSQAHSGSHFNLYNILFIV